MGDYILNENAVDLAVNSQKIKKSESKTDLQKHLKDWKAEKINFMLQNRLCEETTISMCATGHE